MLDVMQILVATLRGAVHQQQRAAANAALLPSLPAYHTSVQFFKRTVPTYRTITKKAYRTSVPYFLAKIEAYRTVLTYGTAIR